jgi:sulfite reductase (ferredoxin)
VSDNSQYKDFDDFLAQGGRAIAEEIAAKYSEIKPFEEDPISYYDFGASEPFSLAGRGPGECGAGVFDLIEVDFATAKDAIQKGNLFIATVAAARSLLVTRGEQADSDSQALSLFQKLFIEPGFISNKFASLIAIAQASSLIPGGESAFFVMREDVEDLLSAVRALYAAMGPSLRLPDPVKETAAEVIEPDSSKDFRGVVVKTKMALDKLVKGAVLEVLLDEQGAKNVPDSASKDGHEIIGVEQLNKHWRILIRKG